MMNKVFDQSPCQEDVSEHEQKREAPRRGVSLQISTSASVRKQWKQVTDTCADAQTVSGFFPLFVRRLLSESQRFGSWNSDQLFLLSEEEAAMVEAHRMHRFILNASKAMEEEAQEEARHKARKAKKQ